MVEIKLGVEVATSACACQVAKGSLLIMPQPFFYLYHACRRDECDQHAYL